ncbi:MAG: 4Fe-4S binding protein, partial [Candidatus Desulforudis sp.]|nr:4Fe-4S binding protein [Desulforudis sp.]
MFFQITNDCIACGTCLESCPGLAIIEGVIYWIDPVKCDGCGTCLQMCPAGA